MADLRGCCTSQIFSHLMETEDNNKLHENKWSVETERNGDEAQLHLRGSHGQRHGQRAPQKYTKECLSCAAKFFSLTDEEETRNRGAGLEVPMFLLPKAGIPKVNKRFLFSNVRDHLENWLGKVKLQFAPPTWETSTKFGAQTHPFSSGRNYSSFYTW